MENLPQVLYISTRLGCRDLPMLATVPAERASQALEAVRWLVAQGATLTVCYLDIDGVIFWEDILQGALHQVVTYQGARRVLPVVCDGKKQKSREARKSRGQRAKFRARIFA